MAQDPKIHRLDNGKWRMRWNNGSKSFTADTRDEVLNGKELAYFDYRPVGTPFDGSALVYMAYDIELATQTPGDYPLTYWVRNGSPGTRTDINTGRAWATFA